MASVGPDGTQVFSQPLFVRTLATSAVPMAQGIAKFSRILGAQGAIDGDGPIVLSRPGVDTAGTYADRRPEGIELLSPLDLGDRLFVVIEQGQQVRVLAMGFGQVRAQLDRALVVPFRARPIPIQLQRGEARDDV